MLPTRLFFALVPVLAAALNPDVEAVRQRLHQPPQPLGKVLHEVFDTDKDGQVTLDEIRVGLRELKKHLANHDGLNADDISFWFADLTEMAPSLLDLLDADGDGTLSFAELEYATKFERSLLAGGGMAGLVRAAFGAFDADGDDRLSVDELLAGSTDAAVLAGVASALHALFPLRATPRELERFVRGALAGLGITALSKEDREASNRAAARGSDMGMGREDMVEYIAWLDADDDGHVQRREVGKRYNWAGKQFLAVVGAVKTVGPLIVMRAEFGAVSKRVKEIDPSKFGEL